MHDIKCVAISYGINNCSNSFSCLMLCELLSLEDLVKQLATFHDFHDHAVMSFILEEVNHFYNVWVINCLHNFYFIFQRLMILNIHFSLRQNLNGTVLSCGSVLGFPDRCKRSLSNSSLDLVVFFNVSIAAFHIVDSLGNEILIIFMFNKL